MRRLSAPVLVAVLLAGLVVLAVGVGVGLPRLSKEGVGWWTVAGLALLVVGGVVAGWAAVSLLRRTRRRWWILTLPLLVVATYLALWTVGQSVAAAFPARPELGARTPADVGLEHRTVRFRTADGVRLAGWYLPGDGHAALALMHGAGSTRSAVLPHAAALRRHGYGVLLFDARGHGGSGGRGMELGWYGERDAAGAVDFLLEQPGVTRVGLVGLSMGGEQAIGAAGVDPRVDAVVAEGATNRVSADKEYLDAYGLRGEVQQGIDRATYGLTGLLSPAPEPGSLRRSVAAATGRPDPAELLLVTADDPETEQLAARHIRGSSEHVEVWTVPGAGHTEGLATAGDVWTSRVTEFLDDALGR